MSLSEEIHMKYQTLDIHFQVFCMGLYPKETVAIIFERCPDFISLEK